jgi:hypothetical protein
MTVRLVLQSCVLPNRTKPWLILLLSCAGAFAGCARPGEATIQPAVVQLAPAPVFVSENPQSIYAADPNDSWNRIFRALFTRTIKARVSDAFPEGAPFEAFQVRMGSFPIRLSTRTLSRTEIGDRAVEPLYPTFFTAEGPAQVLTERFTELSTALREAIDETKNRSAIERALMQADVWAAYDIIYETELGYGVDIPHRRATLLKLFRQFIKKLALSSDEIKSLKSNYPAGDKLPDLFSTESGWLEIELLPHRSHDHAAGFRRAARVFVKPRTRPADRGQFVESLKHHRHLDQVEAVGLVIQNLLIDTSGRIVPSPVFTEVQFRVFKNDPQTGRLSAEAQQFELSRRKLLTDPPSGGLVEYSETSPAYLAAAGNDYDFGNRTEEAGAAVVVPLRTRCAQCHNPPLTTIRTYSIHYIPPVPTTRVLKPLDQERALYVARLKAERNDFKSLSAVQP